MPAVPVPYVSRLFVYPVKSLAGLEVPTVHLDALGARGDRRWVVTRPDGVCITQREEPRLALLVPVLDNGTLRIRRPDGAELAVEPAGGAPIRVTVWDDTVEAQPAGPAADRWLAAFLGIACRIAYLPDTAVRPAGSRAPLGTRVGFHDAYPIHLVSQAAVDALNRRLRERGRPEDITVQRFRPNIVVAGTAPHAEDTWRRVALADTEFAVVKPCDRCSVTTVDPATGLRGTEPLATLATYRRRDGKVFFGQNLVHLGHGEIATEAPVTVLESAA